MFLKIAVVAALAAVVAGGCTPDEFRTFRNYKNGVPQNPCTRATEKCAEGVMPYETVTPESKCCPTCYAEPPSGGSGGHHGGASSPGAAAPTCTADQLRVCREQLEAKLIPKCQEGEAAVPKDCCISCVPAMEVVSACREKSAEDLRLAYKALPVCTAGQTQQFKPEECVPDCRYEHVDRATCKERNGEAVEKCIANADACVPGNMREIMFDDQNCCAMCRPGVGFNIARTADKYRECLKDATYRECLKDETPTKVEGSDCPSCFIPKPVCEPACAAPNPDADNVEDRIGKRCAYVFGGVDISDRTTTCMEPKLKKFCFAVADKERLEKLQSMTQAEFEVELKALITEYCATADAHPYCKLETVVNHIVLGLRIEEFDAAKLCFNIALPPLAKVLTAEAKVEFEREKAERDEEVKNGDGAVSSDDAADNDDATDGDDDPKGDGAGTTVGGGRRKRAESNDDFAVIDAAVGSDYAKNSGGISPASTEAEASGAATLTASTVLLGAAVAVMLL